jgi:predicted outer membrane repeat protein
MGTRANLKTWLVISALLMIGAASNAAGATIYVDSTRNGDGSSWTDAYKYLQDALSAAISGDEIRVAEGIYIPDRSLANPDGSGNRSAAFHLKAGVVIYGGFPLGGGVWDDRDPDTYKTILSGDLNGDDDGFTNNSENSYHVVRSSGTDSTAVLDGFTITAGNANGSGLDGDGGGMYNYQSNAIITHCTFTGNFTKKRGGAIANKQCNLTVANCMFNGNSADNAGGGIFNQNSDPTIINCTFINNSAAIFGGGIHNCSASNETVINCTFTGNTAGDYGGGISNDASSSIVINCILWGNTAPNGSQLSLQSASSLSVSYSDLQDSLPAIYNDGSSSIAWGLGNIADNPLFKPDSYHIQGGSPCIDAGDPSLDYTGQTDVDGEGRVMGQCVDIGSDEIFILVYYVDDDAPGDPGPGDPGVSDPLENGSQPHPFDSIQEAIDASVGHAIINVLDGTYKGPGNRDIDFYGKVIILSSLSGPANCIIDCERLGRGFDFHSGETQQTIVAGFTITNGQADSGGGVRCVNSSPQISNCVISDNKPDGIRTEGDGARIVGNTQLISNNLTGSGTLQLEPNTVINMHGSNIFCDLSGPGTIKVNIHTELTIGGDSVVDLYNPDDPNANGGIECEGPLQVTDNVQIRNANIDVIVASIEDNSDVSHCRISVNSTAPYGQFFIGPNVDVTYCVFNGDGDRYVNLEPSTYAGIFENNKIFITVNEGKGQTWGGLFEARGLDNLAGHSCEPNEFLCQVAPGTIPPCSVAAWPVEQFVVDANAKVNVTNRTNFQPPYGFAGDDEVLYVKELILRENSVFNTGFNRVYYETLIIEPNAVIRDEPLLGFSLTTIAFNNLTEYLVRIKDNNYEDPEDPSNNRIHVERVVGSPPDPNGMMRMTNLLDESTGQVVNARAKGMFSKANEDEILIWFEFLFGTSQPGLEMAELVVYLSDVAEILEHNDPNRIDHYIEVARLYLPPYDQYGAVDSDYFGIFEKTVSTSDLNFIRGVRMELELVGPEGTWILIDNWDPFVSCIYCGDVTGDYGVTARDYLTVLGESGGLSNGTTESGASLHCLDFGFSPDGFVDATDLMGWDWEEWLVSEGSIGDLCFDLCLIPCDGGGTSGSSASMFETTSISAAQTSESTGFTGSLLIAGKRFDAYYQDFLSDRLYEFDESYNLVGGPYAMPNARLNGKLVRDHNDLLYQLNVEEGLVRFSDLSSVIPRGQGCSVSPEPRYGLPATVYVGFQDHLENTWGRPVLDAAFDSQGNVYVAPVVVDTGVGNPYLAAAKLELAPTETPPYNVVKIYDDPPLPTDTQKRDNLCEIELDDSGNVYVINSGYSNSSDVLWVYDSDGDVNKCELQNLGIYGPVGLCCSSYDNSRLYIASSLCEPDAGSVLLYVLSTADLTLVQTITINNLGHITDVTEDPFTGTLWVAGFTMPQYMTYLPADLSQMPQFYLPYLAAVSYGSSGPVQATQLSSAADLGLPLSIAWVGATPEKCRGADLDGSGDVNFGDYAILTSQWLQAPGIPSADIAPEVAGDGIVNFLDLAVLADQWLGTGCN